MHKRSVEKQEFMMVSNVACVRQELLVLIGAVLICFCASLQQQGRLDTKVSLLEDGKRHNNADLIPTTIPESYGDHLFKKSLIRLTENNDRDQTESDHGNDLSSQSTSFLESQEKRQRLLLRISSTAKKGGSSASRKSGSGQTTENKKKAGKSKKSSDGKKAGKKAGKSKKSSDSKKAGKKAGKSKKTSDSKKAGKKAGKSKKSSKKAGNEKKGSGKKKSGNKLNEFFCVAKSKEVHKAR